MTHDGRRLCTQPLVPVVVSSFCVLNDASAAYFEAVEAAARDTGKPFVPQPAGPQGLCQLASLVTVLEVAAIVLLAHSQGNANEADGPAAGVRETPSHSRSLPHWTSRAESNYPTTRRLVTQGRASPELIVQFTHAMLQEMETD